MANGTNGCCGGFWARVGTFFRDTGRQLRHAFSCCRVRNTPDRPQTQAAAPELSAKKRNELAQIILQTVPSAENPIPSAPLNVLPRIQTHRPPIRQDTNPTQPEDTNQPVDPAQPAPAGAEGGEIKLSAETLALCANAVQRDSRLRLDHLRFDTQDITQVTDCDAIVNAAKSTLLGGTGVDGAIHNAAGKRLLDACSQLPIVAGSTTRCLTGEAVATLAFDLQKQGIRRIIHAVGPDLRPTDGVPSQNDIALLTSAYTNSLDCAREANCKAVAMPAISCGVYRFPVETAAVCALTACGIQDNQSLRIKFCFRAQDARIKQTFIAVKQALQAAIDANRNQ